MKQTFLVLLTVVLLVPLIGACQRNSAVSSQVCINSHCVEVEVVSTDAQRQRGLQFRQSLPENSGMLFVFDQSQVHRFWMKDTFIPLDMIWLDAAQNIIHIETHVPPCTADPCPVYGVEKASLFVLEVNAGVSDHYQWSVGQRADFRFR
jgi:uncharacterized membrane protein (UPF0127 family)